MAERHKVMLGSPSGGMMLYGAAKSMFLAARQHDVTIVDSQSSGGNLNKLWCSALAEGENGTYSHFAMLHADICIGDGQWWIDIMCEEMDRLDADLISVAIPIKDQRGVTSSGIGNPNNPWEPYRRFTVTEVCNFPETFNEADAGYPGWPLLHNNGCWMADLRKPVWYRLLPNGEAPVYFQFVERITRSPEGQWWYAQESEDWYFSRKLHEVGAKTYVTSKVKLTHHGNLAFPNWGDWGEYKAGDADTKHNWALDHYGTLADGSAIHIPASPTPA